MYQSRDEVRRVYFNVWFKLQRRSPLEPMEALIAEVIEAHPEYHEMFEKAESVEDLEFTPEQGMTNPFLHMGMHIALREQASADRPPGVKAIYQSLVGRLGQLEAEHAMMECLGEALWRGQRDNRAPDEQAYLECLRAI